MTGRRRSGPRRGTRMRRRLTCLAVAGWIVDPATGHPSTAGHLYFGGRVAQALETMVRAG